MCKFEKQLSWVKDVIGVSQWSTIADGHSLQGSSLMNVPEAIPGLAVVCAGAIEGDNPMKRPKFELFEEDRRPWLGKLNDAAKL